MSPFVFALCFLLFLLFVIISKFELVSVLNFFSLHCYDCIPFASVYSVYSVFIQVFVIAMLFISKASWVVKKKNQKKKSHCIRIRSKQRLFTNQTASLLPFASVYSVYSVFIQVFVIAMLFISKASWVVKKNQKKQIHIASELDQNRDCLQIRLPHWTVFWGECPLCVGESFQELMWALTHWGHDVGF